MDGDLPLVPRSGQPLPGEAARTDGRATSQAPGVAVGARRAIAVAALVIALGNVASRLLGLVREQVMAALFGATGATDAFVAAATVPTIVYDLLIGGAITAALVPVFVERADPGKEDALGAVVSAVLTLAALALLAVAALVALFAPQLLAVLGYGFGPDQRAGAVLMTRVLLVAVVLQGLAGVLMAVLYARRRAALPALAPAIYNAGIIVGALLLHPVLGVGALVAGVLLGAAGQLALQLPGLRGLRIRPRLDLGPEIRAILRLYAPVAAGMVVTIVGIFIDRYLASQLSRGDMTVMSYATRLVQFPLGLVGTAVSYAVLPALARAASPEPRRPAPARDEAEFRATLLFGAKIVLLLMLPATAALMLLREPTVRLLFERGAFTPGDTLRTAAVFLAYAPQLPFTALDQLLIVAFYARKDTRTPVLVGVLGVGVYLAVALGLIGPLGVVGLALANAAQNSAHGLVLLALLQAAVGGLVGRALLGFAGRALLATLAMALALGGLLALLPALLPGGAAGDLLLLGLAALVGLAVYATGVWLLRIEEARSLVGLARTRLGRA